MSNSVWAFLTVDLENMNTPLAQGKYEQSLFSIDVIDPLLEIFDRHKVKGVFFASVYEHCRFNKEAIRDVLQYIDSRGHDVQLHTHPFWCYGREHMWQYSLPEQIKIIKDGRNLLNEWLGRYPIAHRAGAYGINQDTLNSLYRNSIYVDSSMFHQHDNCKLTWSVNNVVEHNGIVEIPITGFYRQYYLDTTLWRFKYKKRFVKTDINWCSYEELLAFVNEAKENNIRVINLFMHSYSLLKVDHAYRRFETNARVTERLEKLLEICTQDADISFITMQDFWEMYQHDPQQFCGEDYVPTIPHYVNVISKIIEKCRLIKQAK